MDLAFSLDELISNPLGGAGASNFRTICSSTTFFVNLAYFIFYSALVVFIVYNVSIGIYKVSTSEEKETFIKFKSTLTNVVWTAIGMGLILTASFLPASVLRLVGVPDSRNIFVGTTNCGYTLPV